MSGCQTTIPFAQVAVKQEQVNAVIPNPALSGEESVFLMVEN
jgi:hypothetical protein